MKSKTITLKVTNVHAFVDNIIDIMYRFGDKGADSIHVTCEKPDSALKIEFKDITDEKLLKQTITATKAAVKLWNEAATRLNKINEIVKNVINLGYDEKENTEFGRAKEAQIPRRCPEA